MSSESSSGEYASVPIAEGWALLAFFESLHAALESATPRSGIERGEVERALAIAGQEV